MIFFTKQNLSKIPKDKKIIVICAYGGRSVAISISLRHIGFKNIYMLKGGIVELAKYMNPKIYTLKFNLFI
ncbi:rhodanese-like domain-containing protein [bacterium]|nr:rhodanese-like domain-containing protein [bacterium]